MTKKSFEPASADTDRLFYTASSFARSSLLYVQEIGGRQTLPTHMSDRGDKQS